MHMWFATRVERLCHSFCDLTSRLIYSSFTPRARPHMRKGEIVANSEANSIRTGKCCGGKTP